MHKRLDSDKKFPTYRCTNDVSRNCPHVVGLIFKRGVILFQYRTGCLNARNLGRNCQGNMLQELILLKKNNSPEYMCTIYPSGFLERIFDVSSMSMNVNLHTIIK